MKLDNLAFQIKLNFQSQESNVFYFRVVYEISEFIVFYLNLKFLLSLFLNKKNEDLKAILLWWFGKPQPSTSDIFI